MKQKKGGFRGLLEAKNLPKSCLRKKEWEIRRRIDTFPSCLPPIFLQQLLEFHNDLQQEAVKIYHFLFHSSSKKLINLDV
jgi:hypothetical protein